MKEFTACAHLGFQFNEFAGFARIEQAAEAGFSAAEWPAIYDFDRALFMQTVKASGLKWAQVTLPMGNVAAGEKGITALPGREAQFEADLALAIDYALELNAPYIHPMAGVNCPLDRVVNRHTYVRNLQRAVHEAKAVGLKVLIEVISPTTVPGYAMADYTLAEDIFCEVEELYLLLDTYHAALITHDLGKTIKHWRGKIGHVQVADVPKRHEPGTGELNFKAIEEALREAGYRGHLGCEYKPQTTTHEGLHHLRTLGWL